MTDWPKNRREDQNYMMYTVESPIQTTFKYYDRKLLTDKFFNSSATYRLDSSVFMPYDALTRITPTTPKEYIWDQKEVPNLFYNIMQADHYWGVVGSEKDRISRDLRFGYHIQISEDYQLSDNLTHYEFTILR